MRSLLTGLPLALILIGGGCIITSEPEYSTPMSAAERSSGGIDLGQEAGGDGQSDPNAPPDPDAGAGVRLGDGGFEQNDAGGEESDAGFEQSDAMGEESDAGFEQSDAGDAGFERGDAGDEETGPDAN